MLFSTDLLIDRFIIFASNLWSLGSSDCRDYWMIRSLECADSNRKLKISNYEHFGTYQSQPGTSGVTCG